ncbi:sensor histidine kinase [Sphingomonas qilianensis]|uniref:histidine kinase n=1 Tax=Sphingomonas qilianensis TaxID=1736690 RepID=A0ABU9XS15_9SPHN
MRFDDSLDTVLAAEMSSPFGAQSAWRQLVDLIGRGRVAPDDVAMARLAALRPLVPQSVRAATARALAFTRPPAALARLFFDEELAIAAPVLRVAMLTSAEWLAVLPGLTPTGRSILRHRRDLDPAVRRALAAFGSDDFILAASDAVAAPEPHGDGSTRGHQAVPAPAPDRAAAVGPAAAADTPSAASPFLSVGSITRGLPVVAEALRHTDAPAPAPAAPAPEIAEGVAEGPFQIAELVARIDAYQRRLETTGPPIGLPADQPASSDLAGPLAQTFLFETDARGVMRWIEGAARAPLIGLSIELADMPGAARVDGIAGGAFRRRADFSGARLVVGGTSNAAGEWRITGTPVFDAESGRFTGYRGTARRPRIDESAAPAHPLHGASADALRQLVHELRTPTNAIAGFAEMIEMQLLGPVPHSYREQAATIRAQAAGLLTAIDDIDLAARLESHALELRAEQVALAPLLARVAGDLAPLTTLRGTSVRVDAGAKGLAIAGDERAVERLIGRLMATLVASGGAGEQIGVVASLGADAMVSLIFDRPRALASFGTDAILSIDAEAAADAEGAPLLGTGFALRLARNLARELDGALTIDARHLTLMLPAATRGAMDHASAN